VSLTVLTAVTEAWEASLVAGLEQVSGQVRVARRCVDLAELLSAAAAGLGRAALLSADVYRLDREAVAQLHRNGVAVLGLSDPDDDSSFRRLVDLGVTRVLPADAPPADVAAAVVDAVAELGADDLPARVGRNLALSGAGDPADALALAPVPADPALPALTPRGQGRLVAVWGPTGAPGRTTVAVTLAGELAALGAQSLLVDADTHGPCIAQALGMLDESGGIAGAVRSANHGALDVERMARLSPSISPTLRVLTGLPQPSRWPELRPSALEVVWATARELARWTVVDCGFGLEADEEVTFDTTAPRRNGATLSALEAADVVIAVGSADPVGLQRIVRGLAELHDVLGPSVRPRVVLTRVRASAVGVTPERRITAALHRYAGIDDAVLIPDDRPACDQAMLSGRMLTEIAPASPARLALAELAAALESAALADVTGGPGVPGAAGTVWPAGVR
jgi:MinD-like ATPase involved in chromosome partitioning or flagellar assembly